MSNAIIRHRSVWSKESLCKGQVDLFFPKIGRPKLITDYAYLCEACPVTFECLVWAIAHDAWGVWGNTTRNERLPLRQSVFKGIKEQAIKDGWYEGTGTENYIEILDPYRPKHPLVIEPVDPHNKTGLMEYPAALIQDKW